MEALSRGEYRPVIDVRTDTVDLDDIDVKVVSKSPAEQIQKAWKCYLNRCVWRESRLNLPKAVYQAAVALNLEHLPKPPVSKEVVRFWGSFVIKEGGTRAWERSMVQRIFRTREARLLLKCIGAKHIVIPRADLILGTNRLVEKRMRVDHYQIDSIQRYESNPSQFDGVVREFCAFLHRSDCIDLRFVKGFEGIFEKLACVRPARFVNCPLYIEDGIGMMALLDLEFFEPWDKSKPRNLFESCDDMVAFFPRHLAFILEVYGSTLTAPQKEILREHARCILYYFKLVCHDQIDFHIRHGITQENYRAPITITPARRLELTAHITTKFTCVRDQRSFEMRQEALAQFHTKKLADKIVDLAIAFLHSALQEKMEQCKEKPSSLGELMCARNKIGTLYRFLYHESAQNEALVKEFADEIVHQKDAEYFLYYMLKTVVEHLHSKGDIRFYLRSRGDWKREIFCLSM